MERLNINTAGKDELMERLGLKESLAERVLRVRDGRAFAGLEDLVASVEGLGPGTAGRIADQVEFGERGSAAGNGSPLADVGRGPVPAGDLQPQRGPEEEPLLPAEAAPPARVVHADLPIPANVEERCRRELGRDVTARGETTSRISGLRCVTETTPKSIVLREEQRCDPLRTVYIVELSSSASAGAGVSTPLGGGSLSGSFDRYVVAEYQVGILYGYEYRVDFDQERVICFEPAVIQQFTRVRSERWVEARVVKDGICKRTVKASGIFSFGDAQAIADRLAGNDPKRRGNAAAGLEDQE